MFVCVLVGGARAQWKALKGRARLGAEQTEDLLQSLQLKMQQISDRRRHLEELVEELQKKVGSAHHLPGAALLSRQYPQCTGSFPCRSSSVSS